MILISYSSDDVLKTKYKLRLPQQQLADFKSHPDYIESVFQNVEFIIDETIEIHNSYNGVPQIEQMRLDKADGGISVTFTVPMNTSQEIK